MRPHYAEVICSFVTDKSFEQFVDIYAMFLMFPKNICEI